MRSIYSNDASALDGYSLSTASRRLVKRFKAAQALLVVLFLAILVFACLWGTDVLKAGGLSLAGFTCIPLAVVVLSLGARTALLSCFGNRASRLDARGQHDWNLYWYRHRLSNNAKSRSKVLLLLASLDVQQGAYELAQMALAEIDASGFTGEQLKLFYLLKLVATAYGTHDHNEAHTWYERYCGIPVKHSEIQQTAPASNRRNSPQSGPSSEWADSDSTAWRFPSSETAQHWALGAAPEPEVWQAMGSIVPTVAQHVVAPLALSAMLAHCVFFMGIWLGTGESWHVRLTYLQVAGLLDAAFIAILVILALVHAYRHRRHTPRGWHRALLVAERVAIVMAALALALYTVLGVKLDSDGTEQTIATNVPSNYGRTSYDYLAVYWNTSYGTSGTTRYYRTRDFILMESWPPAASYNEGQAAQQGNSADDDTGQTDDGASQKTDSARTGVTNTATPQANNEDSTQPSSAAPDSQGYSGAVQNEMQAVYLYLQGQNAFDNMSLSFNADAKGNTYAVVGTGIESRNNADVSYEYRLYDNGERVFNGIVQEEIVLEKCYPNGESDTELSGFYLVNIVDLTVTDEHKTTW